MESVQQHLSPSESSHNNVRIWSSFILFLFLQIAKYISPSDSSNNVSKLFSAVGKYCHQCENIVCVSKYQIVFVQIAKYISHSDSLNIVMIHLSSCWKILPSPYISGCQCMGCKRWWSGYKIGANKAPRAGPGAGGREHSWESGSRKNFCRGKFTTRRVCLTWAKNCVWKKG